MYSALRDAYTIPGPANVSLLASVFEESKKKFHVGAAHPNSMNCKYLTGINAGHDGPWQLPGEPRCTTVAQPFSRSAKSLVSLLRPNIRSSLTSPTVTLLPGTSWRMESLWYTMDKNKAFLALEIRSVLRFKSGLQHSDIAGLPVQPRSTMGVRVCQLYCISVYRYAQPGNELTLTFGHSVEPIAIFTSSCVTSLSRQAIGKRPRLCFWRPASTGSPSSKARLSRSWRTLAPR